MTTAISKTGRKTTGKQFKWAVFFDHDNTWTFQRAFEKKAQAISYASYFYKEPRFLIAQRYENK